MVKKVFESLESKLCVHSNFNLYVDRIYEAALRAGHSGSFTNLRCGTLLLVSNSKDASISDASFLYRPLRKIVVILGKELVK